MSKHRRNGHRRGTKCRKRIDNGLRQRVRKIGGDKFGVLVVDSSKKNAEVWMAPAAHRLRSGQVWRGPAARSLPGRRTRQSQRPAGEAPEAP